MIYIQTCYVTGAIIFPPTSITNVLEPRASICLIDCPVDWFYQAPTILSLLRAENADPKDVDMAASILLFTRQDHGGPFIDSEVALPVYASSGVRLVFEYDALMI